MIWLTFEHTLHELYHEIHYSVDVKNKSKTIFVGESTVLLYYASEPGLPELWNWDESHWYYKKKLLKQKMAKPSGPVIVRPNTWVRESSNTAYFAPSKMLMGIAYIDTLGFREAAGLCITMVVVNRSVDRSIP